MAGAKTDGAASKRGGKGGQRETPPPAEVQIGGAAQQGVVQVQEVDAGARLAATVASADPKKRVELIGRALDFELHHLAGRLKAGDGLAEVEAEIRRRRRDAAELAAVRSQEEREEGLVSVRKAFLPCPMPVQRLIEVRAQFAEQAWELSRAKEAEAARAAAAKAAIKNAEEDLKWLAERAGTGLEDQEVQVEERIEVNEKGEKTVGSYRLDTGERYKVRMASQEDIDAAAQVRLRWGGR